MSNYDIVNVLINLIMASLNQLVSEMAHSLGQPNNHALRENLRQLIIHTRNELIRHSMEQHGYVDSVLQQKFKVSLEKVNDWTGDYPEGYPQKLKIKVRRTTQKVPRPIRLTNNLPFTRVSTPGYYFNKEVPYIKETAARFRRYTPGLKGQVAYDYINDYIYLFPSENISAEQVDKIDQIIIEAAFEHPTEVKKLSGEGEYYDFKEDDNEWFLPEDMIGQIKDIIVKRDLLNNHRETDEIPDTIKTK